MLSTKDLEGIYSCALLYLYPLMLYRLFTHIFEIWIALVEPLGYIQQTLISTDYTQNITRGVWGNAQNCRYLDITATSCMLCVLQKPRWIDALWSTICLFIDSNTWRRLLYCEYVTFTSLLKTLGPFFSGNTLMENWSITSNHLSPSRWEFGGTREIS